jgi:peptidoglycan/LPS O-acetylase OafA/YrhL
MSKKSKNAEVTQYRPDIDGLRGVAVLAVVGFHAFPGIIPGGFIGVDIFFVISGYLITKIILESQDKNGFSYSDFYSRRIRRIFPSLITVLLASMIFGWINLLPGEFVNLGKNIAASTVFLSNLLAYQELNYFSLSAETKPLLHLWSLGIEEQFYLVWPLIIAIAYKRKSKILWVAMFAFAISFTANIYSSSSNLSLAFYMPQNRFWELLIGSLIALSPRIERFNGLINNNQKSIVGAILLLLGLCLINKERAFPGWWPLFPTLGTMLLISSGAKAPINAKALSNRALVSIGLISYPLYIWHWPILSFLYISYNGTPPSWVRLLAVLVSLVLAWLTFLFIEKPLRFGTSSKKKTIGLVIALVIVGCLGALISLKNGIPSRLNPKYPMLEKQFQRTEFGDYDCALKMGPYGIPTCQIGNPEFDPTAAIIGDSHAGNFFWGLSEYLKKNNGNLISLSVGGCPPLLNIEKVRNPNIDGIACEWFKPMFSYLLETPNIKTVYIAFHHHEYFRDDLRMTFIDPQYLLLSNYEKVKKSLKYTIQQLQYSGKKVILIYDMPTLEVDIKKCFSMRPIDLSTNTCDPALIKFQDDFREYDRLISNLMKEMGISVINTHQFINGNFPVNQSGEPMYYDKDHLSKTGSLFFSYKYDTK